MTHSRSMIIMIKQMKIIFISTNPLNFAILFRDFEVEDMSYLN